MIETKRLIIREFTDADYDPRNESSWKLLEKAGLTREAHFRQNIYFHKDENDIPKWKDTYVYAKLNDNVQA